MINHVTEIEIRRKAKEKADIICVCAYCDEVKEITQLILNAGDLPSHGICDEHYEEEMEKLDHLNGIA